MKKVVGLVLVMVMLLTLNVTVRADYTFEDGTYLTDEEIENGFEGLLENGDIDMYEFMKEANMVRALAINENDYIFAEFNFNTGLVEAANYVMIFGEFVELNRTTLTFAELMEN